MKGLLQSLGFELDCARASLNAFVSNALYDTECRIIDKKCERECKQYQKTNKEVKAKGEWQGNDEDAENTVFMNEHVELYMELLQRIAQHEDFNMRNPVDIAIELGYSEEDVKAAFEYMQQMMKDEEEKD